MNSQYTELFRFQSVNMPEDLFHVMRFRGTEGLNTLFTFAIDLVSSKVDVDTTAILHYPGVFTINRKDGSKAVFGGYPSEITQSGHFNGYTYYSVVLRPTFWKLCSVVQSRIFLNKNVKDTVTELLHEQPYFSFPHEFRLGQTSYPVPEFAMQYEESVYDYICWRLEEQGITWHIEQSGNGDKLVFSDTPHLYSALPQTPALRYSPPSGMQVDRDEELITAFNLSSHPLPKQVVIRTYNWQTPNKPVTGKAPISAEGLGDVYLTTEAVDNDAEAGRLAAIRAEELRCRGRMFSGISAVPAMRPGFVFALEEHYNPAFNREYFLTEVTHEGSQEAFLSLGLGIPLYDAKEHFFYHNNFVCIESDVQYRPPRKAPRTAVHGVVHAFIDGAGSGARPELDEFGRYKVLFPFDISSRKKGNASCWVRMAQPQVGNKSGMTFPLLPGTEVTVTFQDGNPDRPVITGALSNGETGALTRGSNTNATGLRTAGGNQLVFNDEDAKQGIMLGTPSGRGLSMSSGSLDNATMLTDTWLKAASTMSAEISTLGHTLFSGFKNAQIACNQSTSTVLAAVAACGTGLASTVFDTLAEQENANLSYGADIAKMLNMAVQSGVNYHLQADAMNKAKGTAAYAAATTELPDKTVSQIQVTPDATTLFLGIVASLIGQAAQFGMEVNNMGQSMEDVQNAEGKTAEDMAYLENKKTAAIHKMLTSSVSDLIPEILTYILTSKSMSTEVKGGVSLQATVNNISMAAKGPVGMHSPHGIFLNALCSTAGGPISTQVLQLYGENGPKYLTDGKPPSEWGTAGNADNAQQAINRYMENRKELEIEDNDRNRSYIVRASELSLDYAHYHNLVAKETISQQAKTHWISTADGKSTLIVREEEKNNIKPGITLSTEMEDANDKHHILLTMKNNDNKKSRAIQLCKEALLLTANDDNKSSTIKCEGEELSFAANNEENLITMGKSGITLTFKGKNGVILDEKSVSIAPDGDAQVSGISFKKNKIVAVTGGKTDVGGELQVLGTVVSNTMNDLKNQLQTQKNTLNQATTKLEKDIDQMNTRLEAIATAVDGIIWSSSAVNK